MRFLCTLGMVVLGLASLAHAQTPLASWSFDEGTGCTTSSPIYPGTLGPDCPTNAPQWIAGMAGQALLYDGTDDAVEVPNTVALDTLNTLTLSAWIKHGATTKYRSIIDKRDAATDGFDLYLDPSGRLFIRVNNYTLVSHSTVADDTWHHVAGVYDGTNLTLYIDGVQNRTAQVGATTVFTNGSLFLGRNYAGNDFTFAGALDEAHLYDTALTAEDVLALYNAVEQPMTHLLLGDWTFDEGTGCVAGDATGMHDGTLGANCPTSGPTWTEGKAGAALQFSAATDAVVVPHTSALSPLSQITMAAWIQHAPTTSYRSILDKRDATADGFDLYLDPASKLFIRINNHTLSSATPVADGQWHHVVGVYDGTELRLYVDGVLDASKIVGLTQIITSSDLMIGHHHAQDGFTFNGVLDAVKLYSVALDDAEVEALYATYTEPPTPSGQLAHWPFDEGTGCVAEDAGTVYTGVLGPNCPDTSPAWTLGVIGGALAFDGVHDKVEVAHDPTVASLEKVTMAAWIQHGPTTNYRSIIDKRDAPADGFDLYLDPSSRLFMRVNQATASSAVVVGDGAWHHVAGTYDGTTIRLYVDGVLQATESANAGLLATEGPLRIGHHYTAESRYSFDGRIDEVYLFDEALDADAISALLPAGPDLHAEIISVSPNPLYVTETATAEAILSAVLPGAPFTTLAAQLAVDPALQLVPNTFTITDCPNGTCTYDAATQTLSYSGALAHGQSIRVTFDVKALAAQVGAAMTWTTTAITPAEAATANLPNSHQQTLDIAEPGSAIAYYVDAANGSNANPGTQAAPFRTLQHCVDLWDGTNRYGCYGAGVFTEEVLIRHGGPSPAQRNQLLPWDTDGDGDLADETFVLDGLGQQNMGIIADFPSKPKNVEIGYLTIRNLEPDGGCGDDGQLIGVHMKCSGGEGCANWWFHHNTLTDIGASCNAASHYIAFQPSNMPNLIFEHNTLTRVGGFMMRYFAGDNITIRNNTFDIHATGIKAWGDYQDSLKVLDNHFICDGNGYNDPADEAQKCGGQTAVNFANNIQNGLISGNTFENCVLPIKIGADERAGVRPNAHHVVENNFIRQTDEICTIYNNALSIDDTAELSDEGHPVLVEDVVFRNNVVVYESDIPNLSQGAAVILRAGHPFAFTSNIRFYNNTIQGYRWGIMAATGLSSNGPFAYQLNGVDVQNNIFSNIHQQQIHTADYERWDLPPPANWTMDYNVYSGADAFWWDREERTLTEWQALGQDANAALCGPAFEADGTFRLAPTDTCALDAGVILAEVSFDRDGDARPAGSTADIGADEVVGAFKGGRVDAIAEQPTRFHLGQNYPNPFNPQTIIRYELAETIHVRLEVLDVLGRTVTILTDAQQTAGTYDAVFDAQNLASGTYFYRLTAGAFVQTRPMLLLR